MNIKKMKQFNYKKKWKMNDIDGNSAGIFQPSIFRYGNNIEAQWPVPAQNSLIIKCS